MPRIPTSRLRGAQELLDRDSDPPAPGGGLDSKLLEEAARAILRDARRADDDLHYLVPVEDMTRLRAAFDEEE